MTKSVLAIVICIVVFCACTQTPKNSTTNHGPLDPRAFHLNRDEAVRKAEYFLANVDKKGNQVLRINKDYLQFLINNSKDTALYFTIGGEQVVNGSETAERSVLLVSADHPTKASDFYQLGVAICPQPDNCGFPLTIK